MSVVFVLSVTVAVPLLSADVELPQPTNIENDIAIVKNNVTERLRRSGYNYEDINAITSKINPNALTIGFARRFATYKRATLIFKDLERITQILNNADRIRCFGSFECV